MPSSKGDRSAVFDASDWAERGFCKQCGTHLFYRFRTTGAHSVPAGLFEDEESLRFAHQVFIDEKPPYYEFANETNEMTGPGLIAKFSNLPDN